jgi:hypothetical protein
MLASDDTHSVSERAPLATLGPQASAPAAGMHRQSLTSSHVYPMCNPDLLLKHSDETVATCKKKTDETLEIYV